MTRSGSRRILAAAVLAAAAACRGKGPPAAAEAVPVRVGKVVQKAVPLQIRNVGTIQPYVAVAVRAQVSGEITQVHFREGQDLKKGELLFSIDPRPYEAALAQAEAALARDRAQMENAQTDVKRYEDLVKKDYVTQQQYDSVKATAAATAATVRLEPGVGRTGAPRPRLLLDPRADRRPQRQHHGPGRQRREGERRRARHRSTRSRRST